MMNRSLAFSSDESVMERCSLKSAWMRGIQTLILRKNLGFQFCAVSYNLKVVVSSPYQQLIREGNHGTAIHFGSDGAQHMFWPLGRSRHLHKSKS